MAQRRAVNRRNSYNARGGEYYSHGSAAAQVAYETAHGRPQRHTRTRTRVRRRWLKKEKVYQYDEQGSHKRDVLLFAIAIAGAVGLLLYLGLGVVIHLNNQHASRLEFEIATIRDANTARQNQIYADVNIDEVRRIATYELFMAPPSPYQFVDIDIVRQSYFSIVQEAAHFEEEFSLSGLFSGLFRTFFSGSR